MVDRYICLKFLPSLGIGFSKREDRSFFLSFFFFFCFFLFSFFFVYLFVCCFFLFFFFLFCFFFFFFFFFFLFFFSFFFFLWFFFFPFLVFFSIANLSSCEKILLRMFEKKGLKVIFLCDSFFYLIQRAPPFFSLIPIPKSWVILRASVR